MAEVIGAASIAESVSRDIQPDAIGVAKVSASGG